MVSLRIDSKTDGGASNVLARDRNKPSCEEVLIMVKLFSKEALIEYKIDLLIEESAKLMTLPDEEFLSPEVTEKLRILNQKILSEIRKLNQPSHVSKYFDKHYQVEEANLDERQCYCCEKIFAIDYKWLDYLTVDGDSDWASCNCPYCGTKLRWHI